MAEETAAAAAMNDDETTTTTETETETETTTTTTSPSSSSNWWGSWYSSAKSKSAYVLEAVKRDLDEISTAVRTEVTNAGTAIGETLRLDSPDSTANTVKKSLSSFFEQVSEVLVPSQEDEDVEVVLITKDGAVTLTGFQKHLAELQSNNDTYLKLPDEQLQENYKRWIEVTDQNQFTQQRLAKHLANSELLNEHYMNLVPEQISHMDFWTRYLFKRALLEDALANAGLAERKAKMEQQQQQQEQQQQQQQQEQQIQADKTEITTAIDKQNVIKPQMEQPKKLINNLIENDGNDKPPAKVIDKDNNNWNAATMPTTDISEEEQARLLQEYEIEILEKKRQKSLIIPLEEKLNNENKAKKQQQQQKTNEIKPINRVGNQHQQQQQQQQQKSKNNDQLVNKKRLKTSPNNNNNNNSSNNTTNNKNTNKTIIGKNSTTPTTTTDPISLKDDLSNNFINVNDCIVKDNDDSSATNSDESWEKDFDIGTTTTTTTNTNTMPTTTSTTAK